LQRASEFSACARGAAGATELLAVAVAGPRSSALLLQGSESGRPPLLRALPWPAGGRQRLQRLAFSAPAPRPRLLLASADGGVSLLANALAALRGSAPPQLGALRPPGGVPAADVGWWGRRDGAQFAYAAFVDGEVCLWSEEGVAVHRARLGAAGGPRLLCAALLPRPGGGCALLLHGTLWVSPPATADGADEAAFSVWGAAAGGARLLPPEALPSAAAAAQPPPAGAGYALAEACWTMLLEAEAAEGGASWALPEASSDPDFRPALLPPRRLGCAGPGAWPPPARAGEARYALQARAGADGASPLLSRLEPSSGLLQLFDPLFDSNAVGVLTVPRGAAALLVTQRLVYCLHPAAAGVAGVAGGEDWAVSALARHAAARPQAAAEAAAGEESPSRLRRTPSGGSPPPPPPPAPALQTLPLGAEWRLPSAAAASVARDVAGLLAPPLPGPCPAGGPVLLWGPACASSLAVGPESASQLFERMLAEADGGSDGAAEALGTALGLDVLALYRQAARAAVRRGDLGRARRMVRLAGCGPEALVGALLQEGLSAEAVAELGQPGGPLTTPAAAAAGGARLLRLACLAHMQLSAWAATAAAAAMQAAPPAAAAAAAAAVGARTGLQAGSAGAAAAAAAAVADEMRRRAAEWAEGGGGGAPPMEEEDLGRLSQAAASACSAAAAAAAIARMLGADEDADGEGEGEGAGAPRPPPETLLRLLLACGRLAEALHGQGVILEGGEGGAWLPPPMAALAAAAAPGVEETVLLRAGTPHAAAAAACGAGDAARAGRVALACLAPLPLLPEPALMRGLALVSLGPAEARDAESQIAALLALCDRATGPPGSPARHSRAPAPAQRALEAALVQLRGAYPPWRAALACAAWGNARGEALVRALQGDWAAACAARLAQLGVAGGTAGEREELLRLLAWLGEPPAGAAPPDAASLAAALRMLAARWAAARLPRAEFEAALAARCEASAAHAEAAAMLLPVDGDGGEGAPVAFSAAASMRLAALRCASLRRAQAASRPMGPDGLQKQVMRNLLRAAETPLALRVQAPPRLDDAPATLLAFSCGHALRGVEEEAAVAEAAAQLVALGAPLAAQLAAATYAQPTAVGLGCPRCVVRAARAMASGGAVAL